MLKLYESFQNTQVMSLRIGGPIAKILQPIINPNNLFIEGWFVEDNRNGEKLILLSRDIRDVMPQGLVVNDHEVLSNADDLVRLQPVLDLHFDLIKLKVSSQNGQKYGKVSDFAFETQSFYIQKIYVEQPLVRNFGGGTLSVDRSQIIEISSRQMIIDDPTIKAGQKVPATSPVAS